MNKQSIYRGNNCLDCVNAALVLTPLTDLNGRLIMTIARLALS